MKRPEKTRIYIVYAIASLVFFVIAVRLYMVQIVYHDEYRAKALRQYETSGSLDSVFDRGSIYFTRKDGSHVAGALIQNGYYMAIVPKQIKNIEETHKKLNSVLSINKDDFVKRASKIDDPFEVIARRLSKDERDKILSLSLSGVSLYPEQWRYYPSEFLSSHIIGFVGFNENGYSGRYGVEHKYENVLKRDREVAKRNAFVELFLDVTERLLHKENSAGDVYMTIEPQVASQVESLIRKVKDKYKATEAGAIVMDPNDGSIISMSALPSYNPNSYGNEKDVSVFKNPLVENSYEMGSIIKPLTMLAGIDAGVITASSTYNDTGKRTYDDKVISNYDGRGRGVAAMQEVLSQSLNTGVSWIMEQVGPKRFTEYMRRFGIGKVTGIDLPNESPGLTKNIDSGRMIESATASFGQGIAISPISAIRALAIIANGGYLVTPHVVEKIKYDVGGEDVFETKKEQVVNSASAKEVTKMLVNVVDEALLKGKAKNVHYTVSAKTGTAQIPKTDGPGYRTDTYLHSFFGYFPAYDPKFIILLYIKEPQGVTYASETLTEPFLELRDFIINYYNIPPDR